MEPSEISLAARFKKHLRSRLISGLLVVIPLGVTYFILRLFFNAMAGFLMPILNYFLSPYLSRVAIEIAAFVIFVLLIYLIGMVVTVMAGRRLVAWGESLLLRIPLVKSIYAASKQVVDTFSHPRASSVQEVVFVPFMREGFKSVAFVTAKFTDRAGQLQYVVFIPTTPNPTTGFMILVPEKEIERTNIDVEEAFKMVVSGGIILPEKLVAFPPKETPPPS